MQTIFTESSHYLLMEDANIGEKISQMLFFSDNVLSHSCLRHWCQKAFLEFGKGHNVFDGKFKKP